jgi:predicted house-cleaning NTP pyrophosphatase (Maf/HAM1 superfamily)
MELRGKDHQVITAVALVDQATARRMVDFCLTNVPMREYSPAEVDDYISSGDPLDKAGAYAIQHPSFHPVALDRLDGCYANVMGLPLCHLLRSMRDWGNPAPKEIPSECRQYTGYDCKVYPSILDRSL